MNKISLNEVWVTSVQKSNRNLRNFWESSGATREASGLLCGSLMSLEMCRLPLTRLEDSATSPQRGEVKGLQIRVAIWCELLIEKAKDNTSPRWGEVAADCRPRQSLRRVRGTLHNSNHQGFRQGAVPSSARNGPLHSGSAVRRFGSFTVNVEPLPTTLSTRMRP